MNIIGLVVSIVFIFFIIFISSLFSKNTEISRKIVHIGVCNWWIIVILFFDNVIYASIVPSLFVIINYLSYKKNIFSSMEREDKKSLGTVYYAISCLVLTLLTFLYFDNKMYACIGLLTMGYGDGFAAIIGKNIKSKEYNIFKQKKSLAGTLTMFIISVLVVSIITCIYSGFSIITVLIISLVATIIEALSPFGLDNITVPIITTILAYLII